MTTNEIRKQWAYKRILNYLYDQESKNFKENPNTNHIFYDMFRLSLHLKDRGMVRSFYNDFIEVCNNWELPEPKKSERDDVALTVLTDKVKVARNFLIPSDHDIYVCDWCGSDDIQEEAYVNPNNFNEIEVQSEGINYCDGCEGDDIEIVTMFEWQEKVAEATMGNKDLYHKILDGSRCG